MTLLASQFSYGGYTVGGREAHFAMLPDEGGLAGLSSPPRTTTLSDRQGHGREPGSQWANERLITAVMYTANTDVLLGFDNAMAPRPDPTDPPASPTLSVRMPSTRRPAARRRRSDRRGRGTSRGAQA